MIDAITLETAHHLGDALASMHRLRHRVFVERQKYNVPTYRNMEWDQFDTPAAVYLVWRDEQGEARAVTRLIPTTLPYMIQELWADLVDGEALPSHDRIWEATRFGIDRGLSPDKRRQVLGELVCGCLEFGLRNDIDEFLCVMPIQIINGAIRAAGVTVDVLGEPKKLGGLPVVSGRVHITRQALLGARRFYDIKTPVLNVAGDRPAPESITNPTGTKTSAASDRRAGAYGGRAIDDLTAGLQVRDGRGQYVSPDAKTSPDSVGGPCESCYLGQPALAAATADEPKNGWHIPFPPPPYTFAGSVAAPDA
jgi:acyl homoserine lactone synthase